MRPIDGDALMKVVKQHHDFFSGAMMDSDKARPDELHQVMADIVNATTIDAIPVEWLKEKTRHPDNHTQASAKWMLGCWKREQEAHNEHV